MSTAFHRPPRRGLARAPGSAGPLHVIAGRADPERGAGYGPLIDRGGGLALPRGLEHKIVSLQADSMSDGNRTPGLFGAMAALPGPRGATILLRNHGGEGRCGVDPVVVPGRLRYDHHAACTAGVTKVVLRDDREVVDSFAIVGGLCDVRAGCANPWGGWIACEGSVGPAGQRPHGHVLEVDAYARGPVAAEPILGAGRFARGPVVWHEGALYQAEAAGAGGVLTRFVPTSRPRVAGDLARGRGRLQALRVVGMPNLAACTGLPSRRSTRIEWVTLDAAATEGAEERSTRREAQSLGAAAFARVCALAVVSGRLYLRCDLGVGRVGQIWELDPLAGRLTLIHESVEGGRLGSPDELVAAPTGDLVLVGDRDLPGSIRALTPGGEVVEIARATDQTTALAGACFSPDGRTLLVNRRGGRDGALGATHAIRGPWRRGRVGGDALDAEVVPAAA